MSESQALDMILWTMVGGAVIGVGIALAFIIGGAIKLGGPEDVPVPDCEHHGISEGIRWPCVICWAADAKRDEERHG